VDPVATWQREARLVTPVERLAPYGSLSESRFLWRNRRALARDLTTGDAIRDAAIYRMCDLWPIVRHELEGVALLQWPWSTRAMDEAGAALDALSPGAVVTYAEAGGWGCASCSRRAGGTSVRRPAARVHLSALAQLSP
jgi:hypothetical protein